jgi:hypothetical protein
MRYTVSAIWGRPTVGSCFDGNFVAENLLYVTAFLQTFPLTVIMLLNLNYKQSNEIVG